mmetsp:Transcript_30056/g.70192  ORF Transcript_30056/g.70192 Transcript_30056/m.70192 type:complete len:475 (+) Transcript_30056:222-1646(+)
MDPPTSGGLGRDSTVVPPLRTVDPVHKPVGGGEEALEEAQEQRKGPYAQAEAPVIDVEGRGLEDLAPVLDAEELDDARDEDDGDEDAVGQQPLEDVLLVVQLARVDLVEDLAPNKGVVDDGVPVVALEVLPLPVWLEGHARVASLVVPRAVGEELRPLNQEKDLDGELVYRLEEDVAPHVPVDKRLVAPVGLAVQEVGGGGLGGEGEGAQGVHDEVDPQKLHRLEGCPEAQDGAKGADGEGDDVDGELELEELADVVVDGPAPHDRLDDRAKVVVQDHHVTRLLRNGRPRDAHAQPHVRLLEGRRVVGTVPRHSHNLAHLLEPLHQHQLIKGARPREHLDPRQDPPLGLGVERAELPPLHGLAAREDASLPRYALGRDDIVTRHHPHRDACLLAPPHRGRNLLSDGVLDTENPNEGEALGGGGVGAELFGGREVDRRHGDGPERPARHFGDVLQHPLPELLREPLDLPAGVHVV